MEQNWLDKITEKTNIEKILKTNEYTNKFGLSLSEEDTKIIVQEKNKILKNERRIELGESIVPQIIFTFCDSDYISQSSFRDDIIRLQDIFFHYKNEMSNEIPDDELLKIMREQFDNICYGDFDYLEGTCLEIFINAIRAGYCTTDVGEFYKIDITKRWDRELFLQELENLF